jgi:DNA-binding NarL/FixJ family response regulator
MNNPNKSRVAIIEPSPVIRLGMKKILEENARFTVTGVYCDLQSFKDTKKDQFFDMILVNPTTIHFHRPFSVKNIFSDYPDTIIAAIHYEYVDSETLAGFDGVLNIYDDEAKMMRKLQQMTNAIGNRNNDKTENVDLSDREKEILISVAKGLTNKEIADKHFISIHTVVSHRKNISRKTGIKTVAGLTLYATFNNLISQEDLQNYELRN